MKAIKAIGPRSLSFQIWSINQEGTRTVNLTADLDLDPRFSASTIETRSHTSSRSPYNYGSTTSR